MNVNSSRQSSFPVRIATGLALTASLLLQLSTSSQTLAQDSKTESESKGEKDEKPKEESSKEKKEAKKDAPKVTAIVGGDIITVTREKIRRGTILIADGKITGLGNDLEIPEDAERIDALGKVITPGFIAINVSRVGLTSSSSRNDKYADQLDPFDRNISLSLGVGITTGCLQIRSGGGRPRRRFPDDAFPYTERFLGVDPDLFQLEGAKEETERDYGEFISTCPCCGLPILPTEPITPTRPSPITPQKNAVIKMSYGKLDGMLVAENVFLDVTPGSLTGAANQKKWREQLASARKYLKDQEAHLKATAAGKKEKPPRKPVSDETLKLVKGEIALRIIADTKSAIQDMVELAKELEYRLVVDGAAEAWVIPQDLAEAKAGVIMTPRRRRQPTFGEEDSSGTWIEMPRVLEESGVPFALTTLSSSISLNGLAGRDLTSLPLEAAFAVRGGASERKALEALTIAPARMLGLDDKIGSLEVGKDADLLILNGNPLDYRTYVETAVVNGRVAYERTKAKVLPVYDPS